MPTTNKTSEPLDKALDVLLKSDTTTHTETKLKYNVTVDRGLASIRAGDIYLYVYPSHKLYFTPAERSLLSRLARLEQLEEASKALVVSCDGRLPADSSDSVMIEAIHVRRIEAALTPKEPAHAQTG